MLQGGAGPSNVPTSRGAPMPIVGRVTTPKNREVLL